MTRGKSGQNRAHKGISAPGSVDGLDRNWRNTIDIITIDDYRTIPAKRNYRLIKAEVMHLPRHIRPVQSIPIVIVRLGNAQQLCHFMFIDQQNVRSLDKFSGQFSNEWRIVEQYLKPGIMTEASTCGDGFHRALQTQSQYISSNQCIR